MAASTGEADTSKSASRLRRGKRASWMRRTRRRSARSSTSDGQHVGQVGQVRGPRALGHLGQALRFGAHRRQVQLPTGRADRGDCCGLGHLGHPLFSNRSS